MFGRNDPNGPKLGALTGTEPFHVGGEAEGVE